MLSLSKRLIALNMLSACLALPVHAELEADDLLPPKREFSSFSDEKFQAELPKFARRISNEEACHTFSDICSTEDELYEFLDFPDFFLVVSEGYSASRHPEIFIATLEQPQKSYWKQIGRTSRPIGLEYQERHEKAELCEDYNRLKLLKLSVESKYLILEQNSVVNTCEHGRISFRHKGHSIIGVGENLKTTKTTIYTLEEVK